MHTPPPEATAVVRFEALMARLATAMPRHPERAWGWWRHYQGPKRRAYATWARTLAVRPVTARDATVHAFIKREKIEDTSRDPRVIQARHTRYHIALGQFLKPLEHALYALAGDRVPGLPPGRVVAKGLNLYARADLLLSKWRRFRRPVGIALDCSRFDAHVSVAHLAAEHQVYLEPWGRDPQLARLLNWQLVNRGITRHGHRYRCPGGRMSGDMNTALGNCVQALALLWDLATLLEYPWDVILDGDDAVLFTEAECLPGWAARIPGHYLEHGHVVKVEGIAYEAEGVLFCTTQLVRTHLGPLMVKTPWRAIRRTTMGSGHWAQPQFRPRYLGLLGVCELSLAMGVPVLQAWALMLLRASSGLPRNVVYYERLFAARLTPYVVRPRVVSGAARRSFDAAFDMDPDTQKYWERVFSGLARRGDVWTFTEKQEHGEIERIPSYTWAGILPQVQA